ncbi:hypothetical protein PsorP6_001565 [Peronosclerospora sorghi]|uniref:Uncharacterized protein n=1 Tax=Peronosclerospora sorghi TaxID=230839 RepID=A0ACC0WT81_9STRA|nr:hypothetical protein PsorP6_001565 [Peronosclerospora sorghi]
MNVLRHVARHFPLFPLEKAAVDDAVTRSSNVDERMDEEEEEEEEEEEDDASIYALVHHVDCDVCHGNEGELLGCTACPGSYHRACLSDVNETHPKLSRIESDYGSTCTTKAHTVARVASLALLDGFPRVLITGKAGMGQQYGPALLHALEGLTHVSLDYPSLLADAHAHGPEEALIRRLREAQTCLPSVVYLPQMDLWWQNTSDAMHLTLKMMLTSLQAQRNLPILFSACTS